MRTIQGIVGAAVLAALAACGTAAEPSPQAPSPTSTTTTTSQATEPDTVKGRECKLAMVKQFQDAMTSSKTGSRPEECNGIDDATVERYAEEIMTEVLGGDTETTSP